jgi:hypothetical protein
VSDLALSAGLDSVDPFSLAAATAFRVLDLMSRTQLPSLLVTSAGADAELAARLLVPLFEAVLSLSASEQEEAEEASSRPQTHPRGFVRPTLPSQARELSLGLLEAALAALYTAEVPIHTDLLNTILGGVALQIDEEFLGRDLSAFLLETGSFVPPVAKTTSPSPSPIADYSAPTRDCRTMAHLLRSACIRTAPLAVQLIERVPLAALGDQLGAHLLKEMRSSLPQTERGPLASDEEDVKKRLRRARRRSKQLEELISGSPPSVSRRTSSRTAAATAAAAAAAAEEEEHDMKTEHEEESESSEPEPSDEQPSVTESDDAFSPPGAGPERDKSTRSRASARGRGRGSAAAGQKRAAGQEESSPRPAKKPNAVSNGDRRSPARKSALRLRAAPKPKPLTQAQLEELAQQLALIVALQAFTATGFESCGQLLSPGVSIPAAVASELTAVADLPARRLSLRAVALFGALCAQHSASDADLRSASAHLLKTDIVPALCLRARCDPDADLRAISTALLPVVAAPWLPAEDVAPLWTALSGSQIDQHPTVRATACAVASEAACFAATRSGFIAASPTAALSSPSGVHLGDFLAEDAEPITAVCPSDGVLAGVASRMAADVEPLVRCAASIAAVKLFAISQNVSQRAYASQVAASQADSDASNARLSSLALSSASRPFARIVAPTLLLPLARASFDDAPARDCLIAELGALCRAQGPAHVLADLVSFAPDAAQFVAAAVAPPASLAAHLAATTSSGSGSGSGSVSVSVSVSVSGSKSADSAAPGLSEAALASSYSIGVPLDDSVDAIVPPLPFVTGAAGTAGSSAAKASASGAVPSCAAALATSAEIMGRVRLLLVSLFEVGQAARKADALRAAGHRVPVRAPSASTVVAQAQHVAHFLPPLFASSSALNVTVKTAAARQLAQKAHLTACSELLTKLAMTKDPRLVDQLKALLFVHPASGTLAAPSLLQAPSISGRARRGLPMPPQRTRAKRVSFDDSTAPSDEDDADASPHNGSAPEPPAIMASAPSSSPVFAGRASPPTLLAQAGTPQAAAIDSLCAMGLFSRNTSDPIDPLIFIGLSTTDPGVPLTSSVSSKAKTGISSAYGLDYVTRCLRVSCASLVNPLASPALASALSDSSRHSEAAGALLVRLAAACPDAAVHLLPNFLAGPIAGYARQLQTLAADRLADQSFGAEAAPPLIHLRVCALCARQHTLLFAKSASIAVATRLARDAGSPTSTGDPSLSPKLSSAGPRPNYLEAVAQLPQSVKTHFADVSIKPLIAVASIPHVLDASGGPAAAALAVHAAAPAVALLDRASAAQIGHVGSPGSASSPHRAVARGLPDSVLHRSPLYKVALRHAERLDQLRELTRVEDVPSVACALATLAAIAACSLAAFSDDIAKPVLRFAVNGVLRNAEMPTSMSASALESALTPDPGHEHEHDALAVSGTATLVSDLADPVWRETLGLLASYLSAHSKADDPDISQVSSVVITQLLLVLGSRPSAGVRPVVSAATRRVAALAVIHLQATVRACSPELEAAVLATLVATVATDPSAPICCAVQSAISRELVARRLPARFMAVSAVFAARVVRSAPDSAARKAMNAALSGDARLAAEAALALAARAHYETWIRSSTGNAARGLTREALTARLPVRPALAAAHLTSALAVLPAFAACTSRPVLTSTWAFAADAVAVYVAAIEKADPSELLLCLDTAYAVRQADLRVDVPDCGVFPYRPDVAAHLSAGQNVPGGSTEPAASDSLLLPDSPLVPLCDILIRALNEPIRVRGLQYSEGAGVAAALDHASDAVAALAGADAVAVIPLPRSLRALKPKDPIAASRLAYRREALQHFLPKDVSAELNASRAGSAATPGRSKSAPQRPDSKDKATPRAKPAPKGTAAAGRVGKKTVARSHASPLATAAQPFTPPGSRAAPTEPTPSLSISDDQFAVPISAAPKSKAPVSTPRRSTRPRAVRDAMPCEPDDSDAISESSEELQSSTSESSASEFGAGRDVSLPLATPPRRPAAARRATSAARPAPRRRIAVPSPVALAPEPELPVESPPQATQTVSLDAESDSEITHDILF